MCSYGGIFSFIYYLYIYSLLPVANTREPYMLISVVMTIFVDAGNKYTMVDAKSCALGSIKAVECVPLTCDLLCKDANGEKARGACENEILCKCTC